MGHVLRVLARPDQEVQEEIVREVEPRVLQGQVLQGLITTAQGAQLVPEEGLLVLVADFVPQVVARPEAASEESLKKEDHPLATEARTTSLEKRMTMTMMMEQRMQSSLKE